MRKRKQTQKEPEWFKGDVKFNEGNNLVEFSIIHNIPHSGDINGFNGALQNWIIRTEVYTAESFVDYINSKHVYKAYTVEQYNKIK